MANYAQRFDGLDLPEGWMDGMNEGDMATLADQVNTAPVSGSLPDLSSMADQVNAAP